MHIHHILIAVIAAALWGSIYISATYALKEFPPIFFTGLRFLLLVVLLFAFLRVERSKIRPLVELGLVMGVGAYFCFYMSLSIADSISAIAIYSRLEVPFAIIMGCIILGEKIGYRRILGITIAMDGALIIGFDPAAFDDIPALIWVTMSAGCGAFGVIRIRKLKGMHPLTTVVWVSTIAAPGLILCSFVFESGHFEAITEASWESWSMLVYTAIASSVVANCGQYYLLNRYPVYMVVPFTLLSPVFAIIGGVWLLGDQLTPWLLVGGAMILGGIGWIYFREFTQTRHQAVSVINPT